MNSSCPGRRNISFPFPKWRTHSGFLFLQKCQGRGYLPGALLANIVCHVQNNVRVETEQLRVKKRGAVKGWYGGEGGETIQSLPCPMKWIQPRHLDFIYQARQCKICRCLHLFFASFHVKSCGIEVVWWLSWWIAPRCYPTGCARDPHPPLHVCS